MASSEAPPPSSGSGKYLVIALLLLAAGGGIYAATRGEPPPPPPPPAEPPRAQRSTALAEPEIPIAEETAPDAGAPSPVAAESDGKKGSGGGGESWSCQGDISAQEIRKVIADSQTQVRACYEKRLRANNNLAGNLVLQVKVGAAGKVISTRSKGSLHENHVANCVENVAKGWTFPVPSGGGCAVFEAPYNFTPKM